MVKVMILTDMDNWIVRSLPDRRDLQLEELLRLRKIYPGTIAILSDKEGRPEAIFTPKGNIHLQP